MGGWGGASLESLLLSAYHDRQPRQTAHLPPETVTVQTTELDLANLLRPVELETFFRDHWEKQPLLVSRRQPDTYRGLFALRDVDQVIAFTRPKFLDPVDFKPGAPPACNVIQGWLADDEPFPPVCYPDISEVHQAFERGKTVIITAMQHRWGPVAALCRNLESYFNCPVHANLYLTPRGAQGFDAHFDNHEVFVLQIEGSKHWRFYGPGRDMPLAEDRTPVVRERLGPPTQEAFVEPGDLLYMPRGHIHEAFTSDCASLHLTIGVKVFRWADLIHQALQDVSSADVRFRASLPPGLLSNGPRASQAAYFQELLALLAQNARLGEAVQRLALGFLARLAMLPNNAFLAGDEAERIGQDTVLEKAPGVICQVVREGPFVSLVYPGNRIDGPVKIASALDFIVRTARFAVRDLPNDLTAEGKLLLVRRLVREHFLSVVSGENNPCLSSQHP
jgi:ribosomal protein L16 Arg81 hydroxylase